MSQYTQISRDILKLRVEQQQLEKDEKILRELILKIRNQQNAVQVFFGLFKYNKKTKQFCGELKLSVPVPHLVLCIALNLNFRD